ncbi:MAG: HPF/RaiA family ribosome-associated protein [Desulfobacteraceae bacterium]|nr:HPF/RaiA family ribosome-associated protein [Desulfobacteraceae bacterium]
MRVPVEVTYRNVAKSRKIETLIEEKVEKLNEFHDGIVSCRISIEQEQESKKTGNPHHVRITLRVPPGQELVVNQKSSEDDPGEPLPAVINEAFKTMIRQLKKLNEKQRGKSKTRLEMPEEVLE